jgi:hypothetical protein
MIGFIDTSVTITVDCNSSQSMSVLRLAPLYWTTSVFSSAWLIGFWSTNRSLLQLTLSAAYDSTAEHSTKLLNSLLNSLTIAWMIPWIHEWTLFYNSGWTDKRELGTIWELFVWWLVYGLDNQWIGVWFSSGARDLSLQVKLWHRPWGPSSLQVFPPGVKPPGREADHLLPFSAEMKDNFHCSACVLSAGTEWPPWEVDSC